MFVRPVIRRKIGWLLERMHLVPDTHITPYPDKWDLSLAQRYLLTARYVAAGYGVGFRSAERRFLRWKDAYRGKRCFIIGNGPSLRCIDLGALANEVTIGVNSIFLSGFVPKHYVVEDVFVAEDRRAEIDTLKGTTKWFGNHLRYCLADDEVCWLNLRMRYNEGAPDFPAFSGNAAREVWSGGTVSYICMQIAYFFGCSPVYLVGFDHEYKIPLEAQQNGNTIVSGGDDPNHFHPTYFGKGLRWHDPRVERMERSYARAKKHFENDNREIINATVGGKLEVFPRVSFESLFRERGR